MFVYVFEGVGFEIKTPGVSDFSEIKKSVKQYPGRIVNRSEYPNGLILEVDQRPEKTIVYSNRPLIHNQDGSYTAPSS